MINNTSTFHKPFTNNKTLRSKKFFLCIHQATEKMIGFESAEERFTKFTFFAYGKGKFHAFYDDEVKSFVSGKPKTLLDLREYQNCSVVCQAEESTKFISFNPWKKEDLWKARLIDKGEKSIESSYDYSCIICFEGNCKINGKDFKELDVADLKKNVEYSVDIQDNCFLGFFELCQ